MPDEEPPSEPTPPPPPVPPFDVTLADVAALVPEATILDTLAEGQRGVTVDDVLTWMEFVSAQVSLRLRGWTGLPTDTRAEVAVAARDVVAHACAAYLEAARHPERASRADTTYATVLWDRHLVALSALADLVRNELELDPSSPAGKPAWSFPPSRVPDAKAW